ncbi:MAG: hypothetical protein M3Q14_02525 [bacterium]|nr:hypothetical protein [bacterium]
MGIFNNKQDSGSQPSAATGPVTSIDGFLSTGSGNDHAMQSSIDDIIDQDDAVTPTATTTTAPTDYLLTDEPLPATSIATQAPINPNPTQATPPQSSDLSDIKQQALKQLTPIVGHLDQSPEEKFHTTMMMLQATDDQSLVNVAYEAAQSITDEKSRAQALLDIVNEINYFTSQNKQQ